MRWVLWWSVWFTNIKKTCRLLNTCCRYHRVTGCLSLHFSTDVESIPSAQRAAFRCSAVLSIVSATSRCSVCEGLLFDLPRGAKLATLLPERSSFIPRRLCTSAHLTVCVISLHPHKHTHTHTHTRTHARTHTHTHTHTHSHTHLLCYFAWAVEKPQGNQPLNASLMQT